MSLSGRSSSSRNTARIRPLTRIIPITLHKRIVAFTPPVNTGLVAATQTAATPPCTELRARLSCVADLISGLSQVQSGLWHTAINPKHEKNPSMLFRTAQFWRRQEFRRIALLFVPCPVQVGFCLFYRANFNPVHAVSPYSTILVLSPCLWIRFLQRIISASQRYSGPTSGYPDKHLPPWSSSYVWGNHC